MRKKVSLTINSTNYNIELEETFAEYLEVQMKKDFTTEGNNDVKILLHAYVQRNAELFQQEELSRSLLEKMDRVGTP